MVFFLHGIVQAWYCLYTLLFVHVVILASTRLRTQDLPPSVHRGRTRLARHEYETLAPYRFFCTVCSFRSKRVSHLHKHMLLHDGTHSVRVLQCPSCPYRTTRANHLSMHRHQHRYRYMADRACYLVFEAANFYCN